MLREKLEDITIAQMKPELKFYLLLNTALEDKRGTMHQSRMVRNDGGVS